MEDKTRLTNSNAEIKNVIGRILSDGVILIPPYTIASVGVNICDALGFAEDQFTNLPLSELTGSALPEKELGSLLQPGWFEDRRISLSGSSGRLVHFMVSGFYMGLITEIENLAILKFRKISGTERRPRQLNATDAALDDFIYATSHGLRGPLATMKGLINLMKIPGNDDYSFIMEKMKYYADRLDDRLHKLIYFAESDKAGEFSGNEVTLDSITRKFQSYGEDAPFELLAVVQVTEPVPRIQNGELILALLRNVRSFFFRNGVHYSDMHLHVVATKTGHEFELSANGMTLTQDQQKKIDTINFGYAEILSDPECTEIYSAKKITLRLRGQLRLQIDDDRVSAFIIIPTLNN